MSNILSLEEEGNIQGFVGDIKYYLRKGDFKSAKILIDDLRKYVVEIQKSKKGEEK